MSDQFNPNEHLMQIKNRNGASDYLPVQWRLVWFREQCPEGTIETEMLHLDLDRETEEEGYSWNSETRRSEKITRRANGLAIFRAVARDGKGGCATGTKSEKAASFPDFIEKAETGAIGRALAALGYGTQFAPELDEQHRIVDAPVDHAPATQERRTARKEPITEGGAVLSAIAETMAATAQQIASLRRLYTHLGKTEEPPAEISYQAAKELIMQLSHEYNESRAASRKKNNG